MGPELRSRRPVITSVDNAGTRGGRWEQRTSTSPTFSSFATISSSDTSPAPAKGVAVPPDETNRHSFDLVDLGVDKTHGRRQGRGQELGIVDVAIGAESAPASASWHNSYCALIPA